MDEWEFYDRELDPAEMKSEYGNPEYTETITQLKTELERLKTKFKVEN